MGRGMRMLIYDTLGSIKHPRTFIPRPNYFNINMYDFNPNNWLRRTTNLSSCDIHPISISDWYYNHGIGRVGSLYPIQYCILKPCIHLYTSPTLVNFHRWIISSWVLELRVWAVVLFHYGQLQCVEGVVFDSNNVIGHLHGLCLAGRVSKCSTAIQGGTPVQLVSWHLDSRFQFQDSYIMGFGQKSRSLWESRDGAQVSRLQCLLHWESIVVTSFSE